MVSVLSVATLLSAAAAWSPTDSYAPGEVDCPSYLDDDDTSDQVGMLRRAKGLSPDEDKWMGKRDNITNENLRWFLDLADMEDFDAPGYLDDLIENAKTNESQHLPRLALAFSGGGYRAMINAGGMISGLDNRTRGCADHGLPILDAASYIAGLSGGSWFVSSLAFNNWTSIQDIADNITVEADKRIWDLDHSILDPYGVNVFKDGSYFNQMSHQVDLKKDAGYNISLTDPWGRGISWQLFPFLNDTGASMTFTSLRDFPCFSEHEMPFPLIVADGRAPGTTVIDRNSTIFEFNPFELGSWDPTLYSFVDLKYVGTELDAGKPSDANGTCMAGLDNTGYVFGTSSTLFNQFLLQLNTTGITGTLYSIAESLLEGLSGENDDIAEWRPNPFKNTPFGNSEDIKGNESLYLVDGGEDGQNIPLYPLIQPERQIDTIFAFDNSMDTDTQWPDGYAMMESYARQFGSIANNTAFPYVPDTNTFLNRNLSARPTFFGCYRDNLTDLVEEVGADDYPPLIIYIANRPYSFNSNTSTFKMSYDPDEILGMIKNGFEVTTRKNLTIDDEYRACIGCALLQRSRERQGLALGDQCQRCFDNYCWDGTLDNSNDTIPNVFTDDGSYYDPDLEPTDADATSNTTWGGVDKFSSSSSSAGSQSTGGSDSGTGEGGSKGEAPGSVTPNFVLLAIVGALMMAL